MSNNEWSPYAPIRMRELAWWAFSVEAARHKFIIADGRMAGDLPDRIMQQLVTPIVQNAQQAIRREGVGEEHLGALLTKLLQLKHWVPLTGQYHLNGKQIFDLDENIVRLLRNTDVSDCTLNDWQAPYDAFYVHFGKQSDMKLPYNDDFEYLDGAFVAVTPWGNAGIERCLKIGLTTVRRDGSGVMMPGYFIDFIPAEQQLCPQQAVDAFIARKIEAIDQDKADVMLAEHRKFDLLEGAQLMRDACALVVNCLYYIENIGGERDPSPGRDVPAALRAKWEASPALRRHKMVQKMNSAGYTLVRIMGDDLTSPANPSALPGSEVSAHWRRGFWRHNQRHGPRNSLVKSVWLRPVLINAAKAPAELPGHVYDVDPKRQTESEATFESLSRDLT
jgi:hypothetical protein